MGVLAFHCRDFSYLLLRILDFACSLDAVPNLNPGPDVVDLAQADLAYGALRGRRHHAETSKAFAQLE